MLHSVHELAGEDAAVLELLTAWPVLEVTLPETEIFLTIRVYIGAESASLAVDELALVLITVRVVDVADAVRDSVPPFSLVLAAVGPALLATAVLHLDAVDELQLSSVDNVVAEVLINAVDDLVVIDGLNFHRVREIDLDGVLREMRNQGIAGSSQQILPRE